MAARLLIGMALLFAAAGPAAAAYQSCGDKVADPDALRCPDGSIPVFNPGSPPADTAPPKPQPPQEAGRASLFGIWHTTLPGAAYERAMDVPGASTLGMRVGLAPGDLTISPNGAYVWNSFTGTSGRWLKTEGDMPLTLFDDALHKRWQVGIVAGQLLITDGKIKQYGRR